jgi:predicted nucleic acid-binding Zn ribbon protein
MERRQKEVMRQCPRCGSGIGETDRYCPQCGAPLGEPKKKLTRSKIYLSLFIVIIIALLAILSTSFFYSRVGVEGSRACRYTTVISYDTITYSTTITSLEQHVLINDKIVVPPGRYLSYQLIFDTQSTLEGYFMATGGSGNDIEITLFTDIGYTNFVNGHSGKYYYSSGKVTTDRFTITIPPGTYYLVLDNSFSTFSNKVVDIYLASEQLKLSYYQAPITHTLSRTTYVCD